MIGHCLLLLLGILLATWPIGMMIFSYLKYKSIDLDYLIMVGISMLGISSINETMATLSFILR